MRLSPELSATPGRLPAGDAARRRRKGILIATLSVLCVSPDAMCVRWARSTGADAWQIAFLKNVLVGGLNLLSALYLSGGWRALAGALAIAPASIAFGGLLQVLDQLGFTFAFLETNAARAMLLIALDPIWAALLGWWALNDRLLRRTVLLLAVGISSAVLVFIPNLLAAAADEPLPAAHPQTSRGQQPTLRGDLIALGTGFCLAAYITFVRYTLRHQPKAAICAAPCLGNFCSAVISVVALHSKGKDADGWLGLSTLAPEFFLVVALDALLLGAFYIGFTIAPRYLTSAEVALVLLLEMLLGPLWVFLRFGDEPSSWTLCGGALLISALITHEVAEMRDSRAHTPLLGSDAKQEVKLPAFECPGAYMPNSEAVEGSVYQCLKDGRVE